MGNPKLAKENIDFSMFLNIRVTRVMRRLQALHVNPCLAPQDRSIQEGRDGDLILKALREAAA
ncbi:MAG: hypothetical protein HRU27_16895 [Rhizobiaceae bacterium]|nr:hypothetical protein [Hyphomicrobiales bacterium]NRB32269.1 hypothetical protein [Rhizobiaceae bacterium]